MLDACDCAPASADLFIPGLKQSAVLGRSTLDVFPTGDIGYGPLDFLIPASDENYYNLRDHRLHVAIKVTKKDGTATEAADAVSVVNYTMNSLFSQVDMYVNETLVTVSTNTYPYTSYMEIVTTYSRGAKRTQLAGLLNHDDTPGKYNTLTDDNEGFEKRQEGISASRTCQLRGALHLPLMRQDRFLLNKCSIRIRLTPSNENFVLLAADANTYKLKIVDARLEVAKLELAPAIVLEHARMLKSTTAKYPIRRSEIKTFSVATGASSTVREALFTGQMPRTVMVGIVASDAYGGSISKNPFNFEHANLSYLCVQVDNVRYPTRPLQPNFNTKNFIEPYESLITGSGLLDEDRDLDITPAQFEGGSALYIIRLTPGEPDSLAEEIRRNGTLRLEAKFRTALTKTVTFIVLASFDNLIEIDEHRSIIKDY